MLDRQINKTQELFECLKELTLKKKSDLMILSLKYDGTYMKCICKDINKQRLYFISNEENHKYFKIIKL